MQAAEVEQSLPVADRLPGRYGPGSVASLSFDKGFTRAADWKLLSLHVPTAVMPKRGSAFGCWGGSICAMICPRER